MHRRRLMALAALMATILLVPHSPVVAQDATPVSPGGLSVTEQRLIDIPDTRLIAMSPDGKWIAAAKPAQDYPRGQLCVYDVTTLAERTCGDLSVLEAGLRIEDVVWSPDSSRLAFAERTFVILNDGDLWVMDAASGKITNVDDDGFGGQRLPINGGEATDAVITLDVNPAWSPDSRTLAFSRTTFHGDQLQGNDIALVAIDGGKPQRLVNVSDAEAGIVYYGIRWAPDGSRVYYSLIHRDSANAENGIWVVDADGQNAHQLAGATDPDGGPPSVLQVSPRGDKLLAFYPIAAGRYSYQGSIYALVDVATGTAEPLTPPVADAPAYAYVVNATISADGSKLLFVTGPPAPNEEVYVRNVDGGESIPLGEGLAGALPIYWGVVPTWAPDGTVFITDGASLHTGTLLRIQGGEAATPIAAPPTESPGVVSTPATGEIAPGATVFVNDDNVPLRAAPSRDATVVLTLARGAALTVVGPAVEREGFVWWPVEEPRSGTIGYLREEFLSAEAP